MYIMFSITRNFLVINRTSKSFKISQFFAGPSPAQFDKVAHKCSYILDINLVLALLVDYKFVSGWY